METYLLLSQNTVGPYESKKTCTFVVFLNFFLNG